MTHTRRIQRVCALIVGSLLPVQIVRSADGPVSGPHTIVAASRARADYLRTPMRFEAARDGSSAERAFVVRGLGYGAYVSSRGATLALTSSRAHAPTTVTMRFIGAQSSASAIVGRPLPGISNYLSGNDPRQWRIGVQAYGEVEYANVYKGVSIRYHGTQELLEYDFIVSPHGTASEISLAFDGATRLELDGNGDLIIGTEAGDIVQHAPVLYQEKDGHREPVKGSFVIGKRGHVGIRTGRYDHRRPLVIDPVLTYSTYLGGTHGDAALAVAVDAQGNIYIAGETMSLDLPVQTAAQASFGGGYLDAFVTKLNAAGNAVIYTTYLGGSDYEYAKDIQADAQGNAYVTGSTTSTNFPIIGGLGLTRRGYSDAFITKLDAAGAIVYSTYLGGQSEDYANGIAVDSSGRAYVVGQTSSTDFPAVNALQPALAGGGIARTEDGGDAWTWLQSGLASPWIASIAVDPLNRDVLYAGTANGIFKSTDRGVNWTVSFDMPVSIPALAIDPSASSTVFAGANGALLRSRDAGATWDFPGVYGNLMALAIDPITPRTIYAGSSGNLISGSTFFKSTDGGDHWSEMPFGPIIWSIAISRSAPSTLYIGTDRGVVKTNSGGDPASRDWTFVNTGLPNGSVFSVAVDPTNASIAYAATNSGVFKTTSGGSQWFSVLSVPTMAVAVPIPAPATVYAGASGGVFVSTDAGASWTQKLDAEISTLGLDPASSGTVYAGSFRQSDAFIARVSPDGSALEYSTFLGGRSFDYANDVALDSAGNAYVVGATTSRDFPILRAAQPTPGGGRDVFVAKVSASGALTYATYLGGSEWEDGAAIAIDSAGKAHIGGYTLSANFPTRRAYQPAFGGDSDAFVTTLDATGTAIEYSTFLGGSGSEMGPGGYIVGRDPGVSIAVAPSGETFVAGVTASHDFPVLRAIQAAHSGGGFDAFVAKFDTDGLLQSATFLGGGGDDIGHDIALASDGSALITGFTTSVNFPTRDSLQPGNAGSDDAFIARIAEDTPDGTPPATTIAVAGLSGSHGWYRSPVTVTLTGTDPDGPADVAFIDYRLNGQGFNRYSAPFALSAEGVSEITVRATDNSGAVEAPLSSAFVEIDTTGPAITVASPEEREYLHSDTLTLNFSARDDVSGLLAGGISGALDGELESNGASIQLLALPLGMHTITVVAADVAGNGAQQSVTFRIVASVDSLIAAVNAFSAQSLIEASSRKTLLAKLYEVKAALDRGNKSAARGSLRDFIDQCSAKSGKGVATSAATVLVSDAQYVLTTL